MVSGTSLVPIVATAAASIADHVIGTVKNGLPFARLLNPQTGDPERGREVLDSAHVSTDNSVGDQVRLTTLRQNIDFLRNSIHATLIDRCNASNIDLSEPFAPAQDPEGRILEVSGHWDRTKIELLFENDADLANQVAQLFRHTRALDAATPSDPSSDQAEIQLVVDRHETFLADSVTDSANCGK